MNITAISIFNQELSSKETPEHVSNKKSSNPQIKQIEVQTMNGRVYDPTIGQFLSPDNYVQFPNYSLGFNRYSYAINNPLLYTDPTGDFIFTTIMFGMAIAFTPPMFIILIPTSGVKGAWEEVYGDDGIAKNMVELGMGLDEHLFGIEIRKDDDLTSVGSSSEVTETPTGTAIDEHILYDVPSIKITPGDLPEMDNGCAFAAAEMLASYYNHNYTMQEYKDAYYNAYPQRRGKGAVSHSQFHEMFMDVAGYGFLANKKSPGSQDFLKDALKANEPIFAAIDNKNSNDHHAIVIYGYEVYENGTMYLLYRDSMHGTPDVNRMSYEDYCNNIQFAVSVAGMYSHINWRSFK